MQVAVAHPVAKAHGRLLLPLVVDAMPAQMVSPPPAVLLRLVTPVHVRV